jgi:polar amino acid transport system substrate-binding protein
MKKLSLAILAATLITSLTACGGGDNTTLRVGTLSDAPPNIYVQNGTFTGFDNELLRAIAEKEGLTLEFASTDFSALLGQVANGQFDLGSSAIAQTETRKKNVDFSDAYDYEVMSIQTKDASTITDETGLAGKRVAVIQATVGDNWLTTTVPAAQAVRFPDYAAALTALKTDAVDAYILDESIAGQNVKESTDVRLKVVKSFTTDVPHGYAVRKGDTALLGKLNDGLKKSIADGTWERLHQQFLPSQPVPAQFKAGA